MALSSASTPSGGKLGKLVGAMALGFEMRDVPQNIKHMMQGNIRRWYNKGGKKRKGSGETPPRGGRAKQGLSNAAWAMGGGTAGALELVEQQRRSGDRGLRADGPGSKNKNGGKKRSLGYGDEKARKARDVAMHKRVERELEEIRRDRGVQEDCGGNKKMGVPPNREVVDKLVAKVIAYRSQMGSKEGGSLFQDKAMNNAVRERAEEYEARK